MLDKLGKISWAVMGANLLLVLFWPSLGASVWFVGGALLLALLTVHVTEQVMARARALREEEKNG